MQLKPSQKLNRRYILLKNTSKQEVEKLLLAHLGTIGFAKVSPLFINSDLTEGIILAINREELATVRAALALSNNSLQVVAVSGTLKGQCKKKKTFN
jgi:RNase P/RNase MRP subunit POP5